MVIKNHEYRIKKMNMIEVRGLQSQITFKDITSTEAREKINELEVK